MSITLLIVESPAKCKKIESFLGNKFKCMASYGHFREVNNLEQIDMNEMTIKYEICKEKKKNLSELKKHISIAKEIILATDNDREGEAIAWHLCDYFKLPVKTTKRILFQEITRSAIIEALNNSTFINMDLVKAQQTRQILDLFVGFKISPILWKSISTRYEKHLSAGRCQTPALRLIYDNFQHNESKSAQLVHTIKGNFGSNNIVFTLNKGWQNNEESEIISFYENCLIQEFNISIQKPKLSTQLAPSPLITSSLQQLASNEMHMSPKNTMKCAQELYENGYITYMRTDKQKYSKEFIEEIRRFIMKEYAEEYVLPTINSLSIDVSKKEEAHEAIRTIDININTADLGENITEPAKKLYKLIRDRTLESCMDSCKIHYINAEIMTLFKVSSGLDAKLDSKYIFKHRSEEIIFPGWRIVKNHLHDVPDAESKKIYQYLSHLSNNSVIRLNMLYSDISLKDNTLHISEAQLVNQLEKLGIGRPSTFSSLVDKIQERDYVKKGNIDGQDVSFKQFLMEDNKITILENTKKVGTEKNKLILTPVGKIVIEFLIKNFNELFYYEFTQKLEDNLDKVSRGELEGKQICNDLLQTITTLIDNNNNNNNNNNNLDKGQFQIDDNHQIVVGKYGAVIKKTEHGTSSFIPIPKGVNIEQLQSGEIKMENVININININSQDKKEFIIEEGEETAQIKYGKYGYFAIYKKKKISLKKYDEETIKQIKMEDITKLINAPVLSTPTLEETGIVRQINESISLRKSKYGLYLFYKNNKMKTPQFLKVDKFKGDIETASNIEVNTWIKETYKLYL